MSNDLEHRSHKGTVFRELHMGEGIFVMPNAWNAGSAYMLEAAGFPAIGTTSAGIAYCLGLPDYEGALSRDAAIAETRRISQAVSIGGLLARATFGLVRRAAEEIRDLGTFTFAKEQVPDAELCRLFAARIRESGGKGD